MNPVLIHEVQMTYYPVLDCAFDLFNNLTEEELKQVRKEDFEETLKHLEYLMRVCQGPPAYEKSERFILTFALKCYKCSNLEKRMHGLSYIEEAIQMVARRKTHMSWDHYESTSSATSTSRSYSVAKWLEPKHIIDFLHEHQILESVFQAKIADMHPELVRR